jgi:hypothetical protein
MLATTVGYKADRDIIKSTLESCEWFIKVSILSKQTEKVKTLIQLNLFTHLIVMWYTVIETPTPTHNKWFFYVPTSPTSKFLTLP